MAADSGLTPYQQRQMAQLATSSDYAVCRGKRGALEHQLCPCGQRKRENTELQLRTWWVCLPTAPSVFVDLEVVNDAISCPCFSCSSLAFFAPACCLASDLAPRYLASGRADPLDAHAHYPLVQRTVSGAQRTVGRAHCPCWEWGSAPCPPFLRLLFSRGFCGVRLCWLCESCFRFY